MESNSEDQRKNLVSRLKDLTGETESRCRSILQNNDWNYDRALNDWYYNSSTWFQMVYYYQRRLVNILFYYWPFGGAEQIEHSSESSHRKFITSFETTFGQTHPRFFEGSFVAACARAKSEFKMMVVYLHSPHHPETERFCRETLCSEFVTEFFNANFLLWGESIQSMEGYTVSNTLGASAYPYLAVLCNNSVGGMTSVFVLDSFIQSEDLIEKLTHVLESYGPILANQKKVQEERNRDRTIKQQQELEYQRSLIEDQEKERRAREERMMKEEKIKQEQEKQEEEARKKRETERRRQELINKMPTEPSPGDGVTQILLRLSDGSRVQRRFYKTDKLQMVYDFVDTKESGTVQYDLVTNFPVRKYDEKNKTLAELGLVPQASLFVQTR